VRALEAAGVAAASAEPTRNRTSETRAMVHSAGRMRTGCPNVCSVAAIGFDQVTSDHQQMLCSPLPPATTEYTVILGYPSGAELFEDLGDVWG
jgi:hypothetical protein